MNRTQYEAIHGRKKKEPCKLCQYREDRRIKRTLARKAQQKAFAEAFKRGVAAGKVIPVFFRDEFTGWHYIDYKGRQELTGSAGAGWSL